MVTLKEVRRTDLVECKMHGVWLLFAKCTLQAVDYDARLLHPDMVVPECVALESGAREFTSMMIGTTVADESWGTTGWARSKNAIRRSGIRVQSGVRESL